MNRRTIAVSIAVAALGLGATFCALEKLIWPLSEGMVPFGGISLADRSVEWGYWSLDKKIHDNFRSGRIEIGPIICSNFKGSDQIYGQPIRWDLGTVCLVE